MLEAEPARVVEPALDQNVCLEHGRAIGAADWPLDGVCDAEAARRSLAEAVHSISTRIDCFSLTSQPVGW